MSGVNCSIPKCGLRRRTHGVEVFQIPGQPTNKQLERAEKSTKVAKNLETKAKWRAEFLNAITKTRVVDANFRTLIEKDRVFVCERHFLPSEFKVHKCKSMVKRLLVPGTIPRFNMKGGEVDERREAEASIRPYRS